VKNHLTLRPPKTLVLGIVAAMFATALLALVAPAPASAALPGYELVADSTEFNSNDSKILQLACPEGKMAIGVGAVLSTGAQGDVVLTALSNNRTGAFFAASEDQDRTTANWSINGSVVCVNPLPGLEYVVKLGPTGFTDTFPATANCPAGKRLLGAAAQLTNGTDGQVSLNNLLLSDTSVTATGAEDQDGSNRARAIFATAVCANPIPGLHIVPGRGTQFSSTTPKGDPARCGTNERALGVGWGVGGDGQVLVFGVALGILGANVSAAEDDDGFDGSWSLNSQVVCATL
jgi:hypothetical protein